MSNKQTLENIKKLRELTGVGFKDCKLAIEENNGDLDKSIEFLRKKGIAKASKKMSRTASEGLVLTCEKSGEISIIEINSETDFVAKNKDFISFVEEVSNLTLQCSGKITELLNSKMRNNKSVNDNLVDLIAKIGEKITIRRCDCFLPDQVSNFSYIHSALKKNIGKIGVLLSLKTDKTKDELTEFGKHLSMHIAATAPMALDKNGIDESIINKEKEIIIEQLKSSGKDEKIIEKIATGKLNKFISDNTLLNQEWIMDPKKKVRDILKEIDTTGKIEIMSFVRYKVGEGI